MNNDKAGGKTPAEKYSDFEYTNTIWKVYVNKLHLLEVWAIPGMREGKNSQLSQALAFSNWI